MYGVKERCVWITHRKDHHPQRLGAAAVVTRHFHVRRHHHRLTSFDRDWLAPLHFYCECAFQNIASHRKTVRMEHSLLATLEARREDTHLLPLAFRHPLDDLAHE